MEQEENVLDINGDLKENSYENKKMENIGFIQKILHKIRNDRDVDYLFRKDPTTEIYYKEISPSEWDYLVETYPDLYKKNENCERIICINVISGRFLSEKGYKKIRIYLNNNGEELLRLES